MSEKLWSSYSDQYLLTSYDKLLVSCSDDTKTTSMNSVVNFVIDYANEHKDINATKIRGKTIDYGVSNPTDGAVLTWNATNNAWYAVTHINATDLQGKEISSVEPTEGQVLAYSSGMYRPASVGGTYVLPTASTETLGGIKVDGTSVTINDNGVISATGGGGASTWSSITGKPFTSFDSSIAVSEGVASVANNGHSHTIANVTGLQNELDNKVESEVGKGLSTEDYTTAEKTKLSGVAENANNYSLPTAGVDTLGGIKVGTNLSIDANGVLSASGSISGDAISIQGVSVATTAPTNGQVLAYNSTSERYEPTTSGGGSLPVVSTLLTLSVAGWDSTEKTQTIAVSLDTNKSNDIIITTGENSLWGNSGVEPITETTTGITFKCTSIPATALTFKVRSMEVTQSA